MKKRVFFVSLVLLITLVACSPKPQLENNYIVQTPTLSEATQQENMTVPDDMDQGSDYLPLISFPTQTPLPPGVLPTPTLDMSGYWDSFGLLSPKYVGEMNTYFFDTLGKCHRSYTDTQVRVWYDGGYSFEATIVGSFADSREGGFVAAIEPGDDTGLGTFTMNMNDRTFSIGCDDSSLNTIFIYMYVPIGKVVEIKLTTATPLIGYYARTTKRYWSLLTPEEVGQITNP